MDYSFVAARAEAIRERIDSAAIRSGRKPEGVELLAVTKFHPIEATQAALEAGILSFGESRVQEAEEKYPAFLAAHSEVRLEMIGHLQSNKIKRALGLFSRIQSVDTGALLLEIDARARASGLKLETLLELHTGEASKAGFRDADSLYEALDSLLSAEERTRSAGGVLPRGLMTMAPNTEAESEIRSSFRCLYKAFEGAVARFAIDAFDIVSMGMSGDFEIAVEEGSTLVRIGSALFGERG